MFDNLAFSVSKIRWDTDGYKIKGLPSRAIIPFKDLIYDGEVFGDDVDEEDLMDRIADILSDKYGFCIHDGFLVDTIDLSCH